MLTSTSLASFYDIVILGGGLAGQLCLWALKKHHPHLRIACFEKNLEISTNLTWSCHRSDISDETFAWFQELVSASWQRHEVIFPEFSRVLESEYLSIRGHELRDKVNAQYGPLLYVGVDVERITPLDAGVRLDVRVSGETKAHVIRTESVIDCRGWKKIETRAWQKFMGLELELEETHGLSHVILKDALVPQIDGYRFFYLLPWTPTRILVEDTYYSHHPSLKLDRIEKEILSYAEKRGWRVKNILRRETGALPLQTRVEDVPVEKHFPTLGASGFTFHPITGYTMPFVLAQIQLILAEGSLSNRGMLKVLDEWRKKSRRNHKLLCFMNRVMFETFSSAERYKILMHFYQLPEHVIERFYRAETKPVDLVHILLTRPPLSYGKIGRMWLTDRFADARNL